jgi:hypothetical protein
MQFGQQLTLLAIAASLTSTRSVVAQSGVTSLVRTVSLSATKTSALSVAVVSGATQSLTPLVDNAINAFAVPVRVSASWSLAPGTASVRMLAYFSNAAQALANGTAYITSARVEGRSLTTPVTAWQPTTWRAFTQNSNRGVGVNGATLRLMNLPITAANQTSSRTMDVDLRINLAGQPPTTAGTYAGTITIRAFTT